MIVLDTGVIYAAFDSGDVNNRACVDLMMDLRVSQYELLVPATVSAEVGYLLQTRLGAAAESDFAKSLALGDFVPIDFLHEDYVRMSALVGKYQDLPLGITDASVIALSERLGLTEVATLDHRHFSVVRPWHVTAFALLPD